MTAFEYGGRMILIDAGLSFPRSELLGIDLVLPDFSYVAEHADVLDAVILTHGHEDHIGALPYLFREIGTQAEVWGTRLTLGLVKSQARRARPARPHRARRDRPGGGPRARRPVRGRVRPRSRIRSPTRWRSSCTPSTARSSTPATSSSTTRRSTAGRPTSIACDELGERRRRAAHGRLDQRRAAGPHAVGADGRRGAARHRPPGAGPRHRDLVRVAHPPDPAGDRRRGSLRQDRLGDRPLDEPQPEHRPEPRLCDRARRPAREAAPPGRVHAPRDARSSAPAARASRVPR